MNNLHSRRRAWLAVIALAAGVGGVALPAAAKPGYSDPAIRAQVVVGMTADQVTQLLGRPTKMRKYRAGSTWGYLVSQENWFLVDFGADGKVKEAATKFIAAW
jgi:outer membrane protein assembly factor BamE (lipoprotein component of BamABCDE complex)